MLKSFKYALKPTKSQKALLDKHIDQCRFIYNLALETKRTAWESANIRLGAYELCKQLTDLKEVSPWLKEVNTQSLQQSIIDLEYAYNHYFTTNAKHPCFKKKQFSGSFRVPQKCYLKEDKLSIPKFREGIKIIIHRQPEGVVKSCTITRTSVGKYFVSVLCNIEKDYPELKTICESTLIGIDLGIKTFIVTSENEIFLNPKNLNKVKSKLSFLSRKLFKFKGQKTRIKLSRLHEKVKNKRLDYLHKVSTTLVKNHDSLAVETLKIKNLMQNKKLAFSIADVSWGQFLVLLEYKCKWNGVNLLKIGTFYPSSKTCFSCNSINSKLSLNDRDWICTECGVLHDRDLNAALNIKRQAFNQYLSGTDREIQNELSTIVEVMTSEAY